MEHKDELLNHEYDDIREYDNDLPRWWLWLFWATILFGVVRIGYYHFGGGLLTEQQLALEQKEFDAARGTAEPAVPSSEDQLLLVAASADLTAKGAQIFGSKCIACHGPQGQGLIGPNLTDDYWIHGGRLTDIKGTIERGVLDKGMLAWKGVLSGDEINEVAAYIWTLNGSNPPNPKPPQGELVKRPAK